MVNTVNIVPANQLASHVSMLSLLSLRTASQRLRHRTTDIVQKHIEHSPSSRYRALCSSRHRDRFIFGLKLLHLVHFSANNETFVFRLNCIKKSNANLQPPRDWEQEASWISSLYSLMALGAGHCDSHGKDPASCYSPDSEMLWKGFTSAAVDQIVQSKLPVARGVSFSARQKRATHTGRPYISALWMTVYKKRKSSSLLAPEDPSLLEGGIIVGFHKDSVLLALSITSRLVSESASV